MFEWLIQLFQSFWDFATSQVQPLRDSDKPEVVEDGPPHPLADEYKTNSTIVPSTQEPLCQVENETINSMQDLDAELNGTPIRQDTPAQETLLEGANKQQDRETTCIEVSTVGAELNEPSPTVIEPITLPQVNEENTVLMNTEEHANHGSYSDIKGATSEDNDQPIEEGDTSVLETSIPLA